VDTKICRRCKECKPISEFWKDKTRKDNLTHWCIPCIKAQQHIWYYGDPKKALESHYEWERRMKREALTYYGRGKLACVLCGQSNIACLSIDHIKGDGNAHKRKIKRTRIYYWLKEQGYPEGYQTLCMNCQFIKRAEEKEYGYH